MGVEVGHVEYADLQECRSGFDPRFASDHETSTLLKLFFFAYNLINLEAIDVPDQTQAGESIEMTCSFELDNEKLYSVKWYKNDEEFYRYVPADFPPAQYLPMPGIRVDLSRSGPHTVFLKNINLSSAGIYRCEVSAEAPEFTTIEEFKEMKVFEWSDTPIVVVHYYHHYYYYYYLPVLPSEGPKITGSKANYNVGSLVELNCISAKSKPAALLRWYINEQSADNKYEFASNTTVHSNGLETSTLGLRFIVTEEHFQSGNMKLKCTATISRMYTMSNEELFDGNRQQQQYRENSYEKNYYPLLNHQATSSSSSLLLWSPIVFTVYPQLLCTTIALQLLLWRHLYS
ncbi:uncharacterized protein LOC128964661 [Oppia nitens]|uniref:uncharacterized protein LOC128964661 n=1 Tax=Oppia nitens TaxID=1686743 RepID=UPI0023DCA1A3|nr:uncharacterized protein LOC128964661 [Oppia nitens]